jgi:hypothetical protein
MTTSNEISTPYTSAVFSADDLNDEDIGKWLWFEPTIVSDLLADLVRVKQKNVGLATGGNFIWSTGCTLASSTGSLPIWLARRRNAVVSLPIPFKATTITSNISLRTPGDGLDTMVGERGYRFSGGEKKTDGIDLGLDYRSQGGPQLTGRGPPHFRAAVLEASPRCSSARALSLSQVAGSAPIQEMLVAIASSRFRG